MNIWLLVSAFRKLSGGSRCSTFSQNAQLPDWLIRKHSFTTHQEKQNCIFALGLSSPNSTQKRYINIIKAGKNHLMVVHSWRLIFSHRAIYSFKKHPRAALICWKMALIKLRSHLFKNLEMQNLPIAGHNVLIFLLILLLVFSPICYHAALNENIPRSTSARTEKSVAKNQVGHSQPLN